MKQDLVKRGVGIVIGIAVMALGLLWLSGERSAEKIQTQQNILPPSGFYIRKNLTDPTKPDVSMKCTFKQDTMACLFRTINDDPTARRLISGSAVGRGHTREGGTAIKYTASCANCAGYSEEDYLFVIKDGSVFGKVKASSAESKTGFVNMSMEYSPL